MKTKSVCRLSDPMVLNATFICLVPLNLNGARKNLLTKRLGEVGATVVQFSTANDLWKTCTHLVIEDTVQLETLLQLLVHVELLELKELLQSLIVVRIKWLSRCLSEKLRVAEAEYSVNVSFSVSKTLDVVPCKVLTDK